MALLIGPPWVVANDVWGEWWQSDWELVLLDDGHVEVLVPLVLPMALVLVLLACR